MSTVVPIETAHEGSQERFNEQYIASDEICRLLNISRSGLVQARQRGAFPQPVVLNHGQIHIWERSVVWPILVQWAKSVGIELEHVQS